MPTIYVTRPIPPVGIDALRAKKYTVRVGKKAHGVTKNNIIRGAKNADALLTLLTDKIDAEVMTALPQLKIIANYAVGYDNIDLKTATKQGIKVTNTPGVLSNAVAEHALTLLMMLAKRVGESDAFTRAGKFVEWDPQLMLGSELEGKVVGVVGMGRIGSSFATKAASLGMRVWYTSAEPVSASVKKAARANKKTFEQIVAGADFILPFVPLLPSTRHMFAKAQFEKMKSTAYLINVARGPVVHERDLVSALRAKKIAGAALDVFEFEPNIAPELKRMTNVVLTPHAASATTEARNAMSLMAAQNIIAALSGKTPPQLLN
jgi:glyoxylate reductase